MATKPGLTRRDFLKASALGLAGVSLLSAAHPLHRPPSRLRRSREAMKPAAAPATAAPAAVAKPAEAPKPSDSTAAKPAAPAAARRPRPSSARSLIGKIEGPTVITDAKRPAEGFKRGADAGRAGQGRQAAAGRAARPSGADGHQAAPRDRQVRRHLAARRSPARPTSENGNRGHAAPTSRHVWDFTGDKLVPDVAKGWELEDGGKTIASSLRKGMKWSDGQPFTADDLMFWFEDIYRTRSSCRSARPRWRSTASRARS